jgi:hypothetical protein
MTRNVLLNNVEHRDLRIIRNRGAQYGDDLMYAGTFPAEFRTIQAHYPIVFGKNPDGTYTPLALLGFREKQNLFLAKDKWDAHYVPLMVERIPFLIGNSPNGKVVHVDIENPRISRTEGERVFNDDGSSTSYLEHVSRALAFLDEGIASIPAFTAALQEHNLLESFVLDIDLRDGQPRRFAGFHTIQDERVAKLDPAAVARLHERGFLQPIYMVIASLVHLRQLIDRVGALAPDQR